MTAASDRPAFATRAWMNLRRNAGRRRCGAQGDITAITRSARRWYELWACSKRAAVNAVRPVLPGAGRFDNPLVMAHLKRTWR